MNVWIDGNMPESVILVHTYNVKCKCDLIEAFITCTIFLNWCHLSKRVFLPRASLPLFHRCNCPTGGAPLHCIEECLYNAAFNKLDKKFMVSVDPSQMSGLCG
jgi:hypothetical protein